MSLKLGFPLSIVLGVAGFISALVWICAPFDFQAPVYFLPGPLFGAMLSVCLWFCKVVRPLWKLLVITAASSIAIPVAVLTGAYLEFSSPWPLHTPGTPLADSSNTALFVGGALGAFLLLAPLFMKVSSGQPATKALSRALCWSLIGGVLGVVGWNLGPWVGNAIWSLKHNLHLASPNDRLEYAVAQGRTGIDSLMVVWQTGIGFLLGIVLTASNSLKETKIPEAQISNF